MGYKFSIEYRKGSANKATDALSRREKSTGTAPESLEEEVPSPDDTPQWQCVLLVPVSQPIPHLLDLLRRKTASVPKMREITKEIREGRAPPHLTLVDGLIYYKCRIFVGSRSSARTSILTEYRSSPSTGHPGFERTLRRITAEFYWPNLKKEVRHFIEWFVVCQTTKYPTQKPGLLQPLPIPS